eukprot:11905812-Ditylum_brightwellii.AAC.2
MEASINSLHSYAMAVNTTMGHQTKALDNANMHLMGVEGYLGGCNQDSLGDECPNLTVTTQELLTLAHEVHFYMDQMRAIIKTNLSNLEVLENVKMRKDRAQTVQALWQVAKQLQMVEEVADQALEEAALSNRAQKMEVGEEEELESNFMLQSGLLDRHT